MEFDKTNKKNILGALNQYEIKMNAVRIFMAK